MSERERAVATWRDLSGAVEWSWTPDRALAQQVRRGTRDSTAGEAESALEETGFVSFQALKRSKLRLKQRLLVLHKTLGALLLVNPEGRAKKIPIRCILRLDAEEDNKLPFRRLFGPSEFGFTLEISIANLDDDERKLSISTRTFLFRSAEDRSKLVQKVRALISYGSFTPPLCAEESASVAVSKPTRSSESIPTFVPVPTSSAGPSPAANVAASKPTLSSESIPTSVTLPTPSVGPSPSAAGPKPAATDRALGPRETLAREEWTAEFDYVSFLSRDARAGDLYALIHGLLRVSNYRLSFAMYAWPLMQGGPSGQGNSPAPGTPGLVVTNQAFISEATVCARVEVPLAAIHEIRIEGIRLQIVTNDLRTLVFCCDMNASKLVGLRDLLLERKARVQIAFTLLQSPQERSWEDWACWHPRQELEILNCALEEAATRVGTPAQDRLVLRLHDQTSAFRTCTSYPRFLAVPASCSEEEVARVAAFRSRGRIPVVRWVHAGTGAVLCRSSQPMVGITNHRCSEDEQLVSKLVQPSQRLFIVDARGRPAVLGNTLQGRGLERASSYQGATIQLCQIGNIHTMRGSVTEVALAFESPSDGVFWERIQNSHWLAHIAGILSASEYVARRLHNGEGSVLVHCSDGFDRTPQLVCMARIILDANARTIDGFCQLLAVEWCAFGHKFAQRSSSRSSSEFSPIFVQFLDAVHNLVRQQPDVFEFNERLLVFLAEHTYSARFGNFLHDSDVQRIKENVAQRTTSVWFEILSSKSLRGRFTNPRFLPFAGPVWPHRGALRLVPFFAFFDAEHRERDGPIAEVEALTCSSEIAHSKSDSSVSSESTILPS